MFFGYVRRWVFPYLCMSNRKFPTNFVSVGFLSIPFFASLISLVT